MKMNRFLALVGAGFLSTMLVACGGGGGSTASTGSGGTPVDTHTFTIASTVVADKGTLPLEHACAKDGGQEIQPSFYWKNAPANTGSYILSVENIGQGDEVYNVPQPYLNVFNIDGSVLSTPASSDLTGLGANVGVGRSWSYAKERTVPCRYFTVLATPYPVQHFRVTIVALSKDMPKTVTTSYQQLDTVNNNGAANVGVLDAPIDYVDPVLGTQHKQVKDYVVGRASMTFDY